MSGPSLWIFLGAGARMGEGLVPPWSKTWMTGPYPMIQRDALHYDIRTPVRTGGHIRLKELPSHKLRMRTGKILKKKVLLRERKRHTAHLSWPCPWPGVGVRGGGVPCPGLGWEESCLGQVPLSNFNIFQKINSNWGGRDRGYLCPDRGGGGERGTPVLVWGNPPHSPPPRWTDKLKTLPSRRTS